MPKIIMTRDERGSRNGLVVEKFKAGVEYDVPESLARAFISIGAAQLPAETAAIKPAEIERPEDAAAPKRARTARAKAA